MEAPFEQTMPGHFKSVMKNATGRRTQGFTLIEMLIVMGIIALILSIAIPNFKNIFAGAEEDTARTFVETGLEAPLLKFKLDTGSYPTSAEGIASLFTAPAGRAAKWRGPYIKKIPLDPWGKEYQYRSPGTRNPGSYDLFSLGRDGSESADDIGNW